MVAEQDVRRLAAVDLVARRASEDDVPRTVARDQVLTAQVRIDAQDVLQDPTHPARAAVVAQDHVVVLGAVQTLRVRGGPAAAAAADEADGHRRAAGADRRVDEPRLGLGRRHDRPESAVVLTAEDQVDVVQAGVGHLAAAHDVAVAHAMVAGEGEEVVEDLAVGPVLRPAVAHDLARRGQQRGRRLVGIERRVGEVQHEAAVAEQHVPALATGDGVTILATEDDQRQGRLPRVDHVAIGEGQERIVRTLGVEDEEVVLAQVEVDHDDVVAEARVERGDRAQPGAQVGPVDEGEGVAAVAGPDGDPVGEVPGGAGIGLVGDHAGSETAELDLGTGETGRRRVADAHARVAVDRRLVADHQQVPAGAGIQVQLAAHVVQVALEQIGRRELVLVGQRRDVVALVAGVTEDVRDRRGPADVEHLVLAGEVDVQQLDAVVVDALGQSREVDRVVEAAIVDGQGLGHARGQVADRVHLSDAGDPQPVNPEQRLERLDQRRRGRVPGQRPGALARSDEQRERAAHRVDRDVGARGRGGDGRLGRHGEPERLAHGPTQQSLVGDDVGRAGLVDEHVLDADDEALGRDETGGLDRRDQRVAEGRCVVADVKSEAGQSGSERHEERAREGVHAHGLHEVGLAGLDGDGDRLARRVGEEARAVDRQRQVDALQLLGAEEGDGQ